MKNLLLAVSIILAFQSPILGQSSKPFLGVKLEELDKSTATQNGIPAKAGVIVLDVIAGGSADKAGLLVGDLVYQIDGQPISDMAAFSDWVGTTEKDQSYNFSIYRPEPKPQPKNTKAKTTSKMALRWTKRIVPVEMLFVVVPKDRGKEHAEREEQQLNLPEQKRPYEIKGDRLGMSLDAFKAKYHRVVPDEPRPAPFVSEYNPEIDNPILLYKAEFQKAGIVHGMTTFPFEANQYPRRVPTIAGAPAELFVYEFIDGQLYEITIIFDHTHFDQVMEAMRAKYGENPVKATKTYQNAFGAKFDGDVLVWGNDASQISVFERAGKLNTSMIIFNHKALTLKVVERKKATIKPRTDDL